MEELKYYKSEEHKKKDKIASLFTIIFTGLFLVILYNSNLVLTAIFFSLFFFIGAYQFINSFKNKVTVVLNNEGIYSKVNGMGTIKWVFIDSFNISDTAKLSFLVAEINNIDEALQNKNTISKLLMKSNIKKLGSPIVFPSLLFQKPLEEVIEEINEFRNNLKSEA